MSSLFVETESGSTYQFIDGKMRRLNTKDILRRDNEWVEFFGFYEEPEVGKELVIFLEPLFERENPLDTTIRMTTPVTKFYEEDYL